MTDKAIENEHDEESAGITVESFHAHLIDRLLSKVEEGASALPPQAAETVQENFSVDEPTATGSFLRRMRAEDEVVCATHELSLVAELLGQKVSDGELILSADSADGLDSILTRAVMRTKALLDLLKDERMAERNDSHAHK